MLGLCALRVSNYTIARFPNYLMVLVAAGVGLAGDKHRGRVLLRARSEGVENGIDDPARRQDAQS